MFHSIAIPVEDQMTHLFLWRNLNTEVDPVTYAMTAVNMGDRPSATIAQTALRKTAQDAKQKFPEAAEIIIRNSYMDDIPGSADSMIEAKRYTKEMQEILGGKNFWIKEWIFSGCQRGTESSFDQRQVQILTGVHEDGSEMTEGVLGMKWDVERDALRFNVNQEQRNKEKITKRSILSTVNSIFDPVGLLTPFTVRTKILLRRIWAYRPKIDWDDELPDEIERQWEEIVEDLKKIKELTFERSLTPEDAVGLAVLVIFEDGSEQAYGTVAYIRWKTAQGYVSRLIAAKSRIAPLKMIDMVRIELCGAVLGTRIRTMIEKELQLKFERVVHIVDSEIVQAMIHRQSYGFNTFAGNRIGEIHRSTQPEEWGWVEGKPWINIADLTTRGCSPDELKEGSIWQEGPEFLKLPENQWPVDWDVKKGVSLPELKRKEKFVGVVNPVESLAKRIDAERFSKWKVLKNTTARILQLYSRYKSGGGHSSLLTPEDLEKAEIFWIKEAQKDMNLKQLCTLRPMEDNGIVVVGGRTERWMACTWNQQKFILLPKECHVSLLIARYEHIKGGHLGVLATVSKIRRRYWIIGITRIIQTVIRNCVFCKIKLKMRCEQIMSPLPVERIKPSPVFTYVGVDYFGPYEVKGEVQQRIRRKCWGVIIVCLNSRAIYLDIANDYSTDAFLHVLRRFVSIRGWPSKLYSDGGSQLLGASNVLQDIIKNLDWEQIKAYGYENKAEWVFSPADAPWYNGATEALVKTVKRALTAAIGENVLKFSEALTCFFEAAQLANQRPIGKHPTSPEEGTFLCPNDLLLGRATSAVPQGPFNERASDKCRFAFTQSVISAFWRRWQREVFPSLVIQSKWHTERRNVSAGDVVLLQDSNLVRGKWKMAVVESAELSKDGVVRHVTVSYSTPAGTREEVRRAVQRLIVLVPADGTET